MRASPATSNLDLNESIKSRLKWEHKNLDLNESMKSRLKWDLDKKFRQKNLDLIETSTPTTVHIPERKKEQKPSKIYVYS